MVLGLRVPEGASFAALGLVIPNLLGYILSFVFLGIYWNNHHHLFQAVQRVNGSVLWANLFLLFWLSLVPFVTAWMGENGLAPLPVALYGVVLIFAAMAYSILVRVLVSLHGKESALAIAVGSDVKGKTSLALYAAAIPACLVSSYIAWALYVIVAIIWLNPDRRIEKTIAS
jgi:uncharacterized membrane protein